MTYLLHSMYNICINLYHILFTNKLTFNYNQAKNKFPKSLATTRWNLAYTADLRLACDRLSRVASRTTATFVMVSVGAGHSLSVNGFSAKRLVTLGILTVSLAWLVIPEITWLLLGFSGRAVVEPLNCN